MTAFSKLSLDDIGTRYRHCADLLEIWQWGVSRLQGKEYISDEDRKRIGYLESGIMLMRRYLDVASGYDDARLLIRAIVDDIPPNPEHIPGGRGEPLPE